MPVHRTNHQTEILSAASQGCSGGVDHGFSHSNRLHHGSSIVLDRKEALLGCELEEITERHPE
jgi:hypothetical protein